MDVKVKLTGTKELQDRLKATPKRINRAINKTINKTIHNLNKDLGSIVPKDAGVSITGFRRVRTKKRKITLRQRKKIGSVWIGANKVAASYAGKNVNVKGGARAGKHFFKGAFVKKMKTGYTSIWKRNPITGKLDQQYVKIENSEQLVRNALDKETPKTELLLQVMLDRELSKKR